MRVRLAVDLAALVNSVFIKMGNQIWQQGPAQWHGHIFTNRILLSIHSESVPGSGSKVRTYSYAKEK